MTENYDCIFGSATEFDLTFNLNILNDISFLNLTIGNGK